MENIGFILYIIGLVILIALCAFSSEGSFKKGLSIFTIIYALPLAVPLYAIYATLFGSSKR